MREVKRPKRSFSIGKRAVGDGQPCFIIGEAGINHNGDLKTAKKLVDAAAASGVDAVKFQTFRAEEFESDKKKMVEYKYRGKTIKEPLFNVFLRSELKEEEWKELATYTRKKGMLFFSTPQNESDLQMLLKVVKLPVIKVGSDDLVHLPQMEAFAKTGIPMIISTGLAYLSEVDEAVRTVLKYHNKLAVLRCVSKYPAQYEELNLKSMETLRRAYPSIVVGFSDHSQGLTAPIAAVALGAKVIEKHFTLSRDMKGPDHPFALEPDELSQLVQEIRNTEAALGSFEVKPVEREMKTRQRSHRSLVASRAIPAGTRLKKEDIAVKRPGTGLRPSLLPMVLGKTTRKEFKENTLITLEGLQ